MSEATAEHHRPLYQCGNLSYNRKQLAILFAWLLWGDFTLTLMITVMPQLLPLSLKDSGADNTVISIVTSTIPTIMTLCLVPVFSTSSDRYRSRFGRRIPFLFWPTPCITLFLILLPFSPEFGIWLQGLGIGLSVKACTLFFVCLFVILYQFFNLSITSVYYYLLADVIPSTLLGRFLGVMRIVSLLAMFVWGRYIFGYAGTHSKEIYIGIGLLYLFSFLLMCYGVREGEYPPSPPRETGFSLTAWVKTYFKECFSNTFYIWVFMIVTVCWFANSNGLLIFFQRDTLGLSLEQIGKINSYGTLAVIPLAYLLGWLVDKINPMRVYLLSCSIMGINALAGFFYLQGEWSVLIYNFIYLTGMFGFQAAMIPSYVLLFPKERFGQFSSANSMMSSIGVTLGGLVYGLLADFSGSYRILFMVQGIAFLLVLLPVVVVSRKQNHHIQETSVLNRENMEVI